VSVSAVCGVCGVGGVRGGVCDGVCARVCVCGVCGVRGAWCVCVVCVVCVCFVCVLCVRVVFQQCGGENKRHTLWHTHFRHEFTWYACPNFLNAIVASGWAHLSGWTFLGVDNDVKQSGRDPTQRHLQINAKDTRFKGRKRFT
jgi:hypothetical protein